ncbi:MAG: hypothetical protein RLZZ303_433 [Candidatus Hydrogenedentota bacterium]|jgi:hypothetical protein
MTAWLVLNLAAFAFTPLSVIVVNTMGGLYAKVLHSPLLS